jgi:hypothetical protein
LIEQVADRLHLRQDQPALGGFLVDGHDEHGHLAGRDEVADDARRVEELLGHGQRISASRRRSSMPSPSAATVRTVGILLDASRPRSAGRRRRGQVGLVEHDDEGCCAIPELLEQMPSSKGPQVPDSATRSRCRCDRRPGASCRRAARPGRPTSSMPAVSMNSTGPMGSSSIGFSTGSVVVPATSETMETCLAGERVQQRRLADVAAAEQADVETQSFGGGFMTRHPKAQDSNVPKLEPKFAAVFRFGFGFGVPRRVTRLPGVTRVRRSRLRR